MFFYYLAISIVQDSTKGVIIVNCTLSNGHNSSGIKFKLDNVLLDPNVHYPNNLTAEFMIINVSQPLMQHNLSCHCESDTIGWLFYDLPSKYSVI